MLIALVDDQHSRHGLVLDWFERTGPAGWASCPITQNGALRILSQPTYIGGATPISVLLPIFARLYDRPGHRFLPDDLSLITSDLVDPRAMATSRDVTDVYLLALAVHHGARLATLDRRIRHAAIRNGADALELVA